MSIPKRLWRVVRGRVLKARDQASRTRSEAEEQLIRARERADALQAHTDAARELREHVGAEKPSTTPAHPSTDDERPAATRSTPAARSRAAGAATPPAGTVPRSARDPFAEEYSLLQVAPGSNLATLEAAYAARLGETAPERFPEGSPERAGAERRKAAIEAAYEQLRDALNTTETRFEKLEF
jgi:hypothetical protein